jgi:Tfp pilus assembly protein PilF
MSEEAWLWRGWAFYRNGETAKAIESWRKAYTVNPNSQDVLYALNFVGATP